jgi:hypothetical protein
MITVEVTGIAALQADLNRLSNVGAVIGPALKRGGNDILDWVSLYPPATQANTPSGTPPESWYERGRGSMYVSKAGVVKVVKSSEMLNRSWSTRYSMTPQEAMVTIGTRASYARFVHHAPKQARFHAARGWRTIQAAIKKFEARIVEQCRQAIAAALR